MDTHTDKKTSQKKETVGVIDDIVKNVALHDEFSIVTGETGMPFSHIS